MKRPYAAYLQQLWGVNSSSPILPEHLLSRYNDDRGSINTSPYNAMPVGSGPFKVIKWDRNSLIRLAANPSYFLGRPNLKAVEFHILSDENTLETALQTHEIDMIAHGTGLNWPRYKAIASDPNDWLRAIRIESFSFVHVDFNVTHAIVGDVAVRRALAYVVNRQDIVKRICHGSATPSETDLHPRLSWAFSNQHVHYPFDRTRARAFARCRWLES